MTITKGIPVTTQNICKHHYNTVQKEEFFLMTAKKKFSQNFLITFKFFSCKNLKELKNLIYFFTLCFKKSYLEGAKAKQKNSIENKILYNRSPIYLDAKCFWCFLEYLLKMCC